ncbi:MFS transporter, partial [Kitasatospora indigofera]|uniref:MFS transporter n=1 Tax=Kitasatospora indigofera TaxID=67307 RepID=UPI0036C8387C
MVTRGRAWAATLVVCSALFLLGLDFTVLNVAVPGLRQDLGPSVTQTQWIVDGYALALGGCVLAAGTLSDTFGRRLAFVAGLTLCAATSVVGAVANGATQVVVARCGMGLGAALFMPATLSTITHVFQGRTVDRRRAMSVWAAVAGIGALTGPVAGGWLVEHYSWRAAFWLNVPVALAVIVPAVLLVPESRSPRPGRLDLPGAALSCGALLALVWGIIEAPERGWTSWRVLTAFAGAAALLALLLRWENCSPAPMLPVGVLRRRGVPGAVLALALMSFAVFGTMFLLTFYLQQVRGLSAWSAGLRITPLSLGLAIGAGATSLLSKRFAARVPVAAGLSLIGLGCVILAGLDSGSGDVPVVAFEALAGFGAG